MTAEVSDQGAPGATKPRLVVFAGETVFAAAIGAPLLASDHDVVGVIISTRTTRSWKRIRKVAGRTFRGYFVYRVLVQVAGIGHRLLGRSTISGLARRRRLKPIRAEDISTDPQVRALLPADIGVAINFDQIIPADILGAFTHGVLNVHAGKLPDDKGISPALWAFARGDSTIWVSMYVMGAGIDTGRVLRQFPVAVESNDSFLSIYLRICVEAGRQFLEVIASLVNGTAQPLVESTDQTGSYHSWPDAEVRAGLRAHGRRLLDAPGLARLAVGLPLPRFPAPEPGRGRGGEKRVVGDTGDH